MIVVLVYFIGCIASYFFARGVLGSKTIGNVLASLFIGSFSWFGLVFLAATWVSYKLFTWDKKI